MWSPKPTHSQSDRPVLIWHDHCKFRMENLAHLSPLISNLAVHGKFGLCNKFDLFIINLATQVNP